MKISKFSDAMHELTFLDRYMLASTQFGMTISYVSA